MDYVIAAVLLIVLAAAVVRAKKHFKGGGCCSSGSNTIRDKKVLTEPVIGEKVLTVEGMTCENCAVRVENALNRLDDVMCRVHLKKKTAVVSFSREISDEVLKNAVERMGYQVTQIRDSKR